jgi:hypothetical protein
MDEESQRMPVVQSEFDELITMYHYYKCSSSMSNNIFDPASFKLLFYCNRVTCQDESAVVVNY